MAGSDQKGIQALIDRYDDADRLVDNSSGLISEADARNAFEDTLQTLRHIDQYQTVAYHSDGTRAVLAYTDGTAAAGRYASLQSWWSGNVQNGDTVYLSPGLYQDDVGSILVISQDDVRVFGNGATLKTGDSIDIDAQIQITGNRVVLQDVSVDGNADNRTGSLTNDGNCIEVTGEDVTLHNVRAFDAPKEETSGQATFVLEITNGHRAIISNCRFGNGGRACVRSRAAFVDMTNTWLYYTRHNAVESSITSIDTGTDTITLTAHGFNDDDYVIFPTGTPAGLDVERRYYVINKTTNTFQVSLDSGGSAVDITSGGSSPTVARVSDWPTSGSAGVEARFLTADLPSREATIRIRGGGCWSRQPVEHTFVIDPADETDTDSVTIDFATDDEIVNAVGHPFAVGNQVRFHGTTLPNPLVIHERYFVTEKPSNDEFKIGYYEAPEENVKFTSNGTAVEVTETNTGGLFIDDWVFDCPHAVNLSTNDHRIKVDFCDWAVFRNVRTTYSGKGDAMPLLRIWGAAAGANTGKYPNVIWEYVDTEGSLLIANGTEVNDVRLIGCNIGPRGNVRGTEILFENLVARSFYARQCTFRCRQDIFDTEGNWPTDSRWCVEQSRIVAYPPSGQNNFVVVDTDFASRGGFVDCVLENRGPGNFWWGNTNAIRTQINRVSPHVIFWQATTYGTTTKTNGDDHLADPTTLTGVAGDRIVGEDGSMYIWNDDGSAWLTVTTT